jgi:uncharacterized protein
MNEIAVNSNIHSSASWQSSSINNKHFECRPLNLEKVRARKINFQFGNDIPRLWLNNRLVLTHFFNGVNLYLPAFESFMVRIMQKQLKHIQDSNFKQQIRGFIAQEMSHGQTHHKYNQVLRSQGYRFEGYLKFADFFFAWLLEKNLGAKISLAAIAGFEHLTAMLTDLVLNQNVLKNATPIMKDLWEWHAAEEVEHGNLAVQLLQVVDDSNWLRIVGIFIGGMIIIGFTFLGMLVLASQERKFMSSQTLVDLYKLLFKENQLVPNCFSIFLKYFKSKNCPSHTNSLTLAEQVFTSKI